MLYTGLFCGCWAAILDFRSCLYTHISTLQPLSREGISGAHRIFYLFERLLGEVFVHAVGGREAADRGLTSVGVVT